MPAVVISPDRAEIVASEYIGVNHPPEYVLIKRSIHRIALGLRCDRTLGAKNRRSTFCLGPSRHVAMFRHTPIHMLMPVGDTERNTVVQLAEARAAGRGVHGADEMKLSVVRPLIEDRGRLLRVEPKDFSDRVAGVGKMVDVLILDVRREHLVAISHGSGGALVLRDRLAQLDRNVLGAERVVSGRWSAGRQRHVFHHVHTQRPVDSFAHGMVGHPRHSRAVAHRRWRDLTRLGPQWDMEPSTCNKN
jgi:hypothetical protein